MKTIGTIIAVALLALSAGTARAGSIGFHALDADAATLATQFAVSASASGKNVSITVSNAKGGLDSVIADVYFDDDAGVLSSLLTVPKNWGTPGAPKDLPGGGAEKFKADFSADGDPPPTKSGFSPGESGSFVFSLASGATVQDVQDALDDESLRLGIHVQSIDSLNDGSRSFISGQPVPEPLTVALVGLGLAGMAVRRRRLAGAPPPSP